jgi:hypothetical protein
MYIDDPIDRFVQGVPGSNRSTSIIANRLASDCFFKNDLHPRRGVVYEGDDIRNIFLQLFQALLFYIPRYLWKQWKAVDYSATNFDRFDYIYSRYIGISSLNFANAALQIVLMQTWLGKQPIFDSFARERTNQW